MPRGNRAATGAGAGNGGASAGTGPGTRSKRVKTKAPKIATPEAVEESGSASAVVDVADPGLDVAGAATTPEATPESTPEVVLEPHPDPAGPPLKWSGPDAFKPMLTPIGDLVPDPSNVRIHPERNIDQIRGMLTAFGQHRAAVVQIRKDGTRIVRVGNGMLEAARSLGWTHLAAVEVAEDDVRATARALQSVRFGTR